MNNTPNQSTSTPEDLEEFVTICAWSNTVKHKGEWMDFATYLERRFGLLASHGMSPTAFEQLQREELPQKQPVDAVHDPKRLAAVRATGLLDSPATEGFDRITRLGATVLNTPVTFISLVENDRDFYLSHCGFGEPLATDRQITGQTFCHFTIEQEKPLVIPDTRKDPTYSNVPTVKTHGIAAYLGVPLVLPSGEVIGAFCAVDFVPHAWSETQIRAANDLAGLAMSEIELRLAALDFQRQLDAAQAKRSSSSHNTGHGH
jgi:hypothetical protein